MIKKTLSFATAAVIIAFFLGCASTDVINQPEAKPPKEKLISSEILNADGRVKERTFKNKNGEMVKAEMFSYYDTGELQEKRNVLAENKSELLIRYRKNKDVHYTQQFVNEKYHGKYREYYENGTLRHDWNYTQGNLDGKKLSYNEQNQLIVNEIMKDGVKDEGLFYTYRDDGSLKYELRYKGGVLEGLSRRFSKQGAVIETIEFAAGKKNGVSTAFTDKGVKKSTKQYINDVQNGLFTTYFASGNVKSKMVFKDGEAQGPIAVLFEDGNISIKAHYLNGQLNGLSQTYYQTGELETEATYLNGKYNGISKSYSKKGNVTYIVKHIEEVKQYSKSFSDSGNKLSDYTFKNGKKSGVSREYFKDGGELSWEVNYKDDLITKAQQFYKEGRLSKEFFFKNGKAVKGFSYTFEGVKTPLTNAHFHKSGFDY